MSPTHMAKFEFAVRTVLNFNDAFNRHDVPGMMALMSDDCRFEDTLPAPDGAVIQGREALTRHWEEFFRLSPKAHIQIEEIFGLGERCVMRWKYTWEDAPGRPGHVRGVDVFRVRGTTILEKLSYVKG